MLHISAGKLAPYAGDYDYYLSKSQAGSARAALTAGEKLTDARPAQAPPPRPRQRAAPGLKELKEQRRAESAARIQRQKERQDREKRAAHLEREIIAWETAAEDRRRRAGKAGGVRGRRQGRGAESRARSPSPRELERLTREWEQAAAAATTEATA